ncbi:hypothetical protein [Caldisphaera lagunensis]|nr:hypothetical protein [Caldisphaera lagunensis]
MRIVKIMNQSRSICDICGINEAIYKCKICKRNVCYDDFDEERGVCKICAASLCQICNSRLSVTYCPYCGRLVCIEDSIQLDNVRRVCIDCYKKGAIKLSKNLKYVDGAIKLSKRVKTL